jgi:phosphatidylinositol alpha-1,6-mannosyltransferase
MGTPFIVGAQGTYGVKPLTEQPERILLKYAYNTAKAIHVPSVYTRDAILKYAGENYDITVIHNGVDFNRFNLNIEKRNPIKERYENKKILLTVGQLKSRKGQDIVIRALPEILKRYPETIYLIVGSDGWNGYLRKLADEIGVGEHVVCTGSVSYNEIIQYFHACDVYVHTPRVAGKYFFEGFGIVYLEAGACGKPAVGTDALHGETGFVAGNEDVAGVSEYICKLLGDPKLRLELGNNAREYAKKHVWEAIADQYIDMYTSVLKKATQ